MKKIILSLFLFLVIFQYKTTNLFAGCAPAPNRLGCPSGTVCQNKGLCCTDKTDCSITDSKKSSDAGSDPTCLGGNGIDTAIGCIPISDTNSFMGWILGWAVGVGGGIAFLLIVYASFMVMTSQGVPDRLKAGQELLTSAISGLIMLIFSVFILKFIGIDILGLGSFGFGG